MTEYVEYEIRYKNKTQHFRMRPTDKLFKAKQAFCEWAPLFPIRNYGLVIDDGKSTICLDDVQAINVKNLLCRT
jgi:hypothetical protein